MDNVPDILIIIIINIAAVMKSENSFIIILNIEHKDSIPLKSVCDDEVCTHNTLSQMNQRYHERFSFQGRLEI